MTTELRALCAELTDALHNAIRVIHHEDGTLHISTAEPVLERARSALSEPEPEGPTDEELSKLLYNEFTTNTGHGWHEDVIGFARAVLARWGASSGATLESGDKSTTQSKGLNRQEMKTFACEWWNKFGFVKDKATCTWVIDEIGPDHFVDFMFDVLAKYGNDTQPTEES